MEDKLSDNLRKLRVERGLSQENVADHHKIGLSTYSRYESNKVEIPASFVRKIAEWYQVPLDRLYYGTYATNTNNEPIYTRTTRIPVLVELDGSDDTLKYWVDKLSAINRVV